jgi:hypothetical protein
VIPSPKILAAVGTVLIAAAFVGGRLSAPRCAPSLEVDHSKDNTVLADDKVKGVEVQQVATQAATDHQQVRTVVKVVRVPGGPETTTTTKVETHDQATTATLATARASWERETTTRIEDIQRDHVRQLAAARPDWSVTAIAGANVPDRERFIAGSITRRVLGPFELGLFASTRGDVGAALGARW